jgi:hypothetical protein
LPMFVRSRPSRARWTTSPIDAIGYDDEVNSQAASGRASVGPAISPVFPGANQARTASRCRHR